MPSSQPLEPLAIVGMSCRFPNGANSLAELWSLLSQGQSAWTPVPESRFNEKAFHHPSPESNGSINQHGGHFLDQNIKAFDAEFFGLSPAEAKSVDPQQRIQLESAYEALENAGITLESVRGTNTAVYTAIFSRDYDRMQYKDTSDMAKYHVTGVGDAILSNRVSYVFDLRGPSMTLDTGCSGSMVALHQACQGLRLRESDMALVSGVNLMLTPDAMVPMTLLHILNRNGRCYTFDKRGSGYGRGEGVATIVLKRLEDAIASGDPIHAVVRNTGVNQDGKTQGIALPSSEAQRELITSVYRSANIDPQSVSFVEAHGTGTEVGDKAELDSICEVFCKGKDRRGPLYVGSIKSNIGHLESCSGLAGIIKAVLALQHRVIPPNVNFEEAKESLSGLMSHFTVPLQNTPWPNSNSDIPRYASVNNFGYGGTNAHCILESYTTPVSNLATNGHRVSPHSVDTPLHNGSQDETPKESKGLRTKVRVDASSKNGVNGFPEEVRNCDIHHITQADYDHLSSSQDSTPQEVPRLFVLTAKNKSSLQTASLRLAEWLSDRVMERGDLADLAYTLCSRRSQLAWRRAISATSSIELEQALVHDFISTRSTTFRAKNLFVFTGQGTQYYSMGRELIGTDSKFRESLVKSDQILKELGAPWSLLAELQHEKEASRINDSKFAQPCVTALQIALVELLASVGVRPKTVIGHSSGEVAAAYAAGALSQREALEVSYHRGRISEIYGRLSKSQKGASVPGAMLAVGLGEDAANEICSSVEMGKVKVACINSPLSTTLSGDESGILQLQKILDQRGVFNRRLKVDLAYHSHHMKEPGAEYRQSIQDIDHSIPRQGVQFISSVTGGLKSTDFGPDYWVQNLVSRVNFSTAIETYCSLPDLGEVFPKETVHNVIEIGPHNSLSTPIRQTVTGSQTDGFKNVYYPTLVRGQDAVKAFLDLAGRLFTAGHAVDLVATNALDGSLQNFTIIADLPPYAWDHSNEYWHESRLSAEHRMRLEPHHDLLGIRMVGGASHDRRWRNLISIENLPWIRDHVVDSFITFPGSAYLCMALEALSQLIKHDVASRRPHQYVIRDVEFLKALLVPDVAGSKVEIQLSLTPSSASNKMNSTGWEVFEVNSWTKEGGWSQNCRGSIMAEYLNVDENIEEFQEHAIQAHSQLQDFLKIKKLCKTQLDSKRFYEDLEASGNRYGKTFATLEDINVGSNHAIGKVVIPKDLQEVTDGDVKGHSYIVHPATLDALLHASFPVCSRDNSVGSIMIVGVEELRISADLNSQPGQALHVGATVPRKEARSSTAFVSAFESSPNSLRSVISIHGELQAVGEAQPSTLNARPDAAVVYSMKWESDVEFVTEEYFSTTPQTAIPEDIPPSETPDHAADATSSESKKIKITPEEKRDVFLRAACIFIHQSIRDLSAREDLKIASHMTFFYEWIQKFSTSQEYLKVTENFQSIDDLAYDLGSVGVEGEILQRVGTNLTTLLTGGVDPLTCLLDGGLLHRFYADDESLDALCAHLVAYLKLAIFKNPRMKVLEIGAGTGGTTFPVFKGLTTPGSLPFKHYDYTDISSGFFGNAQEKFKDWSEMLVYKVLNIEFDPIDQGFEEGTYDLIIASNVIHATERINVSLDHIRKLLKPGGRLALLEVTQFDPVLSMVFGILPGWWRGRIEGRMDSPILSETQWNRRLLEQSFSGVDMAAHDFEGRAQRSAMLISTVSSSPDVPKTIATTSIAAPSLILLAVCIIGDEDYLNSSKTLSSTLTKVGCQVSQKNWEVKHSDGPLYLVIDSRTRPLLRDVSKRRFDHIKSLLTQVNRILWVTIPESSTIHSGGSVENESGLVTGLSRVARSENDTLKIVTLDIQTNTNEANIASVISNVISRCFLLSNPNSGPGESEDTGPGELEYVYRDGRILIPRVIPEYDVGSAIDTATQKKTIRTEPFHQADRPLKLVVQSPGSLDSMVFDDCKGLREPLAPNEVEIHVKACGINFKDVFIALGRMKGTDRMAGECTGYVRAVGSNLRSTYKIGDRVVAWNGTPYASRVRVPDTDVCPLPDSISYTVGASIPAVFATAYYCLVDVARLQKGQTILINAASGGVGQAALMITQWIGAKAFVTVGSPAKRDLVVEKYNIRTTHIFSSRALNFKKGIMRLTDGKGVDVILNSSSGEALQDSWECIASFGTFVEIGKSDIYQKGRISMKPFDRHVTFASVDFLKLANERPQVTRALLGKLMDMFAQGIFNPVEPVSVYPMSDVEGAFRKIQSRTHMGKLVLEADDNTMVKATSAPMKSFHLEQDGTYVIAGGLGSIGLPICHFLASRGAGNILILSRKAPDEEARSFLQREVESYGTKVMALQCNISELSDVSNALVRCRESMPPVKGVINCVMNIKDSILEQMDADIFHQGVKPKMLGTTNLDDTFGGSELDFFVMLSSISGILGFRSQSNYAAGNTFQDAFAQARRNSKTRYVSLNLGMVTGSRIIDTSSLERINWLHREGGLMYTIQQVLALLEYSVGTTAVENGQRQLIMGFDRESIAGAQEIKLRQPMLRYVAMSKIKTSQQTSSTKEDTCANNILASQSIIEVHEVIVSAIVKQIATIMAMDEEKVELDAPTATLGLDSLISVELKNWIRRTLDATVQTSEILDMSSIRDLATVVTKRSKIVPKHLSSEQHVELGEIESTPGDALVSNGAAMRQDDVKTRDENLPATPLPDLKDTLALYQESISTLLTERERQQLQEAVAQFLAPDGPGQRLQGRLKARDDDIQLDSWLVELYNNYVYLKSRAPINPYQHFWGTHTSTTVQHSQAERAAVITLAAMEFKALVDTHQIAPDLRNEQPLCMYTLDWIFNATRRPCLKVDEVRRFPGHDFILVVRNGHYIKIDLKAGSQNLSHNTLLETFQAILDKELPKAPSIAALTADDRDTWAHVREKVESLSQQNRDLLEMLDQAAFIVYLDTASPSNASERCQQFLYGDPSCRWSDKTLQFAVCPNGVSAYVCEHAPIDGGVLDQLNQKVKKAILDHQPSPTSYKNVPINGNPQTNGALTSGSTDGSIDLPAFTFSSNEEIDTHISHALQVFKANARHDDFIRYRSDLFGGTLLRSQRCAPKSGFQIVIQLASLSYFGYQPASWETVSMRNFHKGRVDIYQAVIPPIRDFCFAMKNAKTQNENMKPLRSLFDDAARAHAALLAQVSQGRGFAGHMYALQEVVGPGEEMPALFKDGIYAKTRPAKLMTDCAEWRDGIQDGGFAMPDPEHVWVHYEIDDTGCNFAIRGPGGKVDSFISALKTAMGQVKELLDSI